MTISCIVKGNKYQAAAAAAVRHIPFAFRRENFEGKETIGEVGEEYHDRLAKWFYESPSQSPFPVGTLLFYRIMEGPWK